jgi:hypothetical protein
LPGTGSRNSRASEHGHQVVRRRRYSYSITSIVSQRWQVRMIIANRVHTIKVLLRWHASHEVVHRWRHSDGLLRRVLSVPEVVSPIPIARWRRISPPWRRLTPLSLPFPLSFSLPLSFPLSFPDVSLTVPRRRKGALSLPFLLPPSTIRRGPTLTVGSGGGRSRGIDRSEWIRSSEC